MSARHCRLSRLRIIGEDNVFLIDGHDVRKIRERNFAGTGLCKAKDKSLKDFTAHCVDSFSMCRVVNPDFRCTTTRMLYVSRDKDVLNVQHRQMLAWECGEGPPPHSSLA
jgi:hypothetical protein